MKLYGIYDVVKQTFAPPFVARNEADAVRMFLMDCKKLPFVNDLRLFEICDIDLDNVDFPISGFKAVPIPVDLGVSDAT